MTETISFTPAQWRRIIDLGMKAFIHEQGSADYISMDQTMIELGCNRTTIWRYRKEGRLRAYDATGELLFSISEVRMLKMELTGNKQKEVSHG